jgi:hypothetical protein
MPVAPPDEREMGRERRGKVRWDDKDRILVGDLDRYALHRFWGTSVFD